MATKRKAYKPRTIILPAAVYHGVRKLTEWYDATPDFIELGEDANEQVWNKWEELVGPHLSYVNGEYVASVQIETRETAQDGCKPGQLVVLVESDASIVGESHVLLLPEPRRKRKQL